MTRFSADPVAKKPRNKLGVPQGERPFEVLKQAREVGLATKAAPTACAKLPFPGLAPQSGAPAGGDMAELCAGLSKQGPAWGWNKRGSFEGKAEEHEAKSSLLGWQKLADLLRAHAAAEAESKSVEAAAAGSVKSIKAGGEKTFASRSNSFGGKGQKRAFEVIVSALVLAHFDEVSQKARAADLSHPAKRRKVKESEAKGTLLSKRHAKLKKEKRELQKLSGLWSNQMIMLLAGAGGPGKSRVASKWCLVHMGFATSWAPFLTKEPLSSLRQQEWQQALLMERCSKQRCSSPGKRGS